ncbi:S-layer homology domain-containing protein [Deinococcus sonorensis]|uniref:S-layer homology domain-containing protein n=1 Tax=Deinococcus sonorensis TaxID=309891 RepID=A0ABV8YA05_9DEIO
MTRPLPMLLLSALLASGAAGAQTQAQGTATAAASMPATRTVTLTDVPAGHWSREAIALLMQRGLIQGLPDGTFRGTAPLTRYEAAALFARLLQDGLLTQGRLSDQDLLVVARGVGEVSSELRSLTNRLDRSDARVTQLEGQVAALVDTVARSLPQTSNAAGRLSAVESAVTAMPALLDAKASSGDVQALQAQVVALQAQVQSQAQTLSARQSQVQTQAQAATPPIPDVPIPDVPLPAPSAPHRYSAGLAIEGTPQDGHLQAGAAVDLRADRVVGPLGLRAAVNVRPGAGSFGAEMAGTLTFDGGGVQPYLGLGGGVVYSPARDGNGTTHDLTVLGLAGVDYPVSDSMSLFGEGQVRYVLSNQGSGTGLSSTQQGGLGGSLRAGVRVSF